PLRARNALIAEWKLDVFVDIEVGDQVEALEDEADMKSAELRELVDRAIRKILAAEHVATARRRVDETDDVEHRRLAAPRRPHHRDELAALDREVDSLAGRAGQRSRRRRL